jgi:nucleoside-diphosphate-sugar epimerase
MFIGGQIAAAKGHGFVGYVGAGDNLWPACHVSDASALYILALTSEKVQAGATLNGVGEAGIPLKDIAEFIARKLGMETKSVKAEDAQELWGFLGHIVQMGGKITNEYTREWTGWNPNGPTLFEDMDSSYKF